MGPADQLSGQGRQALLDLTEAGRELQEGIGPVLLVLLVRHGVDLFLGWHDVSLCCRNFPTHLA